MDDLFQHCRNPIESVMEGVTALAAAVDTGPLLQQLNKITAASPFRNMVTPGGKPISVAVTNCGVVGWVSDRRGYRYQKHDPETGHPWPAMPTLWRRAAIDAAAQAGFDGFKPNACLINRYLPGNQLTAHQDKNEGGFEAPVVTISTGLPAEFLIWGEQRGGTPVGVPVYDGDIVVMGGPARLHYHGVRKLAPGAGDRPAHRISLTFREVDLGHAWQ